LRGEAPTHLEIARALGVTRQAVTERLAWMSKKGLVRMNHGRWSRTSGLTREGAMALAERLAPPAAAV
jgi:predicted transcriptional regulator